MTKTKGTSARSEMLEPRMLLSAAITDAHIEALADADHDGYARSGVIYIDFLAQQTQSVFVVVEEDDGGSGNDRIYQSESFDVDFLGISLFVPIHGDFMNLPGDDRLNDLEFVLKLYDSQTGELLQTYDAGDDADLGGVYFESSFDDGGLVGARPQINSVTLDPDRPLTAGENLTVTVRASDSLLGGGGVQGMYWWIDFDGDSNLDPGNETSTLRRIDRIGGSPFNGTWRSRLTVPDEYGTGTFPAVVAAWDADGNLAPSFDFELTITGDQPPQVTGLDISRGVISPGDQFNLTATVTDDDTVSVVTFFYDANDDGIWTPGTDTDLGADYNGADGWRVTATARPEWGSDAQARFVADARDNAGQWTITPRSVTARLNALPVVTSTSVDGPGYVTVGEVVTVRATATDDTGLRGVTFYLDRNQDGRWTPGTDTDLGADYDGTDGWSRAWVVQQGWVSAQTQIRAVAIDVDGIFGAPGAPATVAFNARPVVTGLEASAGVVTWGQSFTLTATANDPDGTVRLVNFFADLDRDGLWTPGTDVDLGFDSNAAGGWSISRAAMQALGTGMVRFVAGAQDNRDAWAVQGASVEVRINAPPVVTGIMSSPVEFVSWGQTLRLTATATDNAGVSVVTFFFDLDSNGRFTPGDVDLGADFNGADGWSISKVVPRWWGAGPAKFVASARDADGAWSTQTATVQIGLNDRAQITGFMGTPNPVGFGSSLQLDLRARDISGVSAVTMFVDINADGRWTPGVDIDLGTANRHSGNANDGMWRKSVTADWGHGTFRILADAKDALGVWTGGPTLLQVVVT